MLKKFNELSLDEIEKAFKEALESLSSEEETEIFKAANVFDYIYPLDITMPISDNIKLKSARNSIGMSIQGTWRGNKLPTKITGDFGTAA